MSVARELVVEVLSPDDRMVDVEEKIADYLEMGVGGPKKSGQCVLVGMPCPAESEVEKELV